MVKAVIIDDEKQGRANLKSLVERLENKIELTGEASNVEEAYNLINTEKPDLVFLDIEMPGGTGFDLLGKFNDIDFEVIFVTAYDHYAVKAIRFSALGYVMKPISFDDLSETVTRALDKVSKNKSGRNNRLPDISKIVEFIKQEDKVDKIFVPDMNGFSVLETKDILLCEADGSYTKVMKFNGDSLLCTKSLKEFQEILPNNTFYRVSKSYIINIDHILQYKKGSGGTIVMSNKFSVDVPRRGKEEFLNFLSSRGFTL